MGTLLNKSGRVNTSYWQIHEAFTSKTPHLFRPPMFFSSAQQRHGDAQCENCVPWEVNTWPVGRRKMRPSKKGNLAQAVVPKQTDVEVVLPIPSFWSPWSWTRPLFPDWWTISHQTLLRLQQPESFIDKERQRGTLSLILPVQSTCALWTFSSYKANGWGKFMQPQTTWVCAPLSFPAVDMTTWEMKCRERRKSQWWESLRVSKASTLT